MCTYEAPETAAVMKLGGQFENAKLETGTGFDLTSSKAAGWWGEVTDTERERKKKKPEWGLLEMKIGDWERDRDRDADGASLLLTSPAAVLSLTPQNRRENNN